jgi:lipid A 4'-phosphatase
MRGESFQALSCRKGASMRSADLRHLTVLWIAAFVLSVGVFALWPGLDLAVSAAFFTPGEGFLLSGSALIEVLREAIWGGSIVVALGALAGCLAALIGRPFRAFDVRRSAFILSLYLLGPALLVDGVLKRFWGRARPANVEAFGGTSHFTPPWLPAHECASNCSFVSGEGAAATALAISLAVLAPAVRQAVPQPVFRTYVVLAVVLPATGLVLRVMLGRHFLSDTVFAMLFVSGIALVLGRLLLTPRRR